DEGKAVYAPAAKVAKPKAWALSPEIIHAVGWSGYVVVLWHDCQIDKWLNQRSEKQSKAFAAGAPILPMTAYQPAEHRTLALAVKNVEYFHHHEWQVYDRQFAES